MNAHELEIFARKAIEKRDEAGLKQVSSIIENTLKTEPHHNVALFYSALIAFLHKDPKSLLLFQKALDSEHPQPPPIEWYIQYAEALLHYRRFNEALKLTEKGLTLAHNNTSLIKIRSYAFTNLGQKKEAISLLEDALSKRSNEPTLMSELGNLYAQLTSESEREKGLALLRQAEQLNPNNFQIAKNLAAALIFIFGKFEEAETLLQRALAKFPNHAVLYSFYGLTYVFKYEFSTALEYFNKANKISPNFVDAHVNTALALLSLGDYTNGFIEYEWRHLNTRLEAPKCPQWLGTSLKDRTILVLMEQGFGDTFQFIRYVQILKKRGAYVVFSCPQHLKPLISQAKGVNQVVAPNQPLPSCDFHVYLLSLPLMLEIGKLGLDLNKDIEIPYLKATPQKIEFWGNYLKNYKGFKIGIAWQGQTFESWRAFRSIPLKNFERLANIEGVQLFSLQKGKGEEQLKDNHLVHQFPPSFDQDERFMDTAAVMQHLDLVITTDTSIAHLAGAIGIHVWTVISFQPEWRWMLQIDQGITPWYPTMRLFKQNKADTWDEVFDEIMEELRSLIHPFKGEQRIYVPIPPGELIDRITILQIKAEHITDPVKLEHIQKEWALLQDVERSKNLTSDKFTHLKAELLKINNILWDLEDHIRECEHRKEFDAEFIELARSVYFNNDKRAELKKQINLLAGSDLMDEKSYSNE